jgi:TfoX/Sxy family transcriptional regulator of competence genes
MNADAWRKSSEEMVARFTEAVAGIEGLEQRKMFGYPAAFVGGNMATGLFAEHWVVRLPDAEIAEAKAAGAGSFEPMPGRPMKAFVVVPAAEVTDDSAIARWVERGLAHAASLPAKK